MRSRGARSRPTAGRKAVTSPRSGLGACPPEAMKAARPPGLRTAKACMATSPPTVSDIAARFQHAKHFVANSQISDARAECADHTGEIAPQDHGKARLGVFAGAHLPVGAVDACGKGIDDDLARPGRWIGKIAVLQDLRS